MAKDLTDSSCEKNVEGTGKEGMFWRTLSIFSYTRAYFFDYLQSFRKLFGLGLRLISAWI